MEKTLKAGGWAEITQDVNAIPAGIYKVEAVEDCLIHFRVGKSVMFCVSSNARHLIRPVTSAHGAAYATTVKSFTDRYYPLLAIQRTKPHRPFGPVTMCALTAEADAGRTAAMGLCASRFDC